MPKKVDLAPKKSRKVFKRGGSMSDVEKEFVTQFVQDQPAAITPSQERSLAKVMRRSREAVKSAIEEAKDKFVASAERYVDIHRAATEAALFCGDNEQALKGSQWALTNIGAEGSRIIDKTADAPTGSRIMIGIRVGGIDKPITAVALEAEPPHE
jgi:hypothetical protein